MMLVLEKSMLCRQPIIIIIPAWWIRFCCWVHRIVRLRDVRELGAKYALWQLTLSVLVPSISVRVSHHVCAQEHQVSTIKFGITDHTQYLAVRIQFHIYSVNFTKYIISIIFKSGYKHEKKQCDDFGPIYNIIFKHGILYAIIIADARFPYND